jgi:hypothetical protein
LTTAVHEGPAPGARARASGALPSPARLALAVAAALIVTAAAWLTGDWWNLTAPESDALNLTAARALIFLAVFATVLAVPAVVRRAGRAPLAVFAPWAVYLGLWLTALWPGPLMTDTVDVLANSRQGIVYEWFSYAYSLLAIAALDVVPHVASLAILQIVLTAALIAYASALLLRRGSGALPVVVLNVLAAVSVPVVVNSLLVTRDTVFAVLHVFLALYVADAVVRRSLSRGGLVGVALLVGLLSVLRGDGVMLALCVPLLLLALRPARRQLLAGAALFAASLVLFHAALPAVLHVDPKVPHAYGLSLRMNPLGAVLNSDFYSPDKERDLATLGRVIDVEAVRQSATPLEIPAYWEGHWNKQATVEDFAAFKAVADRLMRDNLPTVFANRVQTFGAATGLAPGGFTGTELPEPDRRLDWVSIPQRSGLTGSPPSDELYEALADPLREVGLYRGLFSYRAALQFNLLPWLLLLAAVLPFWRRARLEAVFAVIILSRVPLVFAAAPAAQFKYYYSVLLGGFVLAALLLSRLRRDHLRRLVPARRRHQRAVP